MVSLLFPPCCVLCQKEGSLFCDSCQDMIDFLYFTPRIPLLEPYSPNLSILSFYTPPLSTVIRAYKYKGLYKLAPLLAKLLYDHLQFPLDIDYVTSTPLHPRKQRLRGFNQTELLAQELAKNLHKPYLPFLKKKKHTQSLASTENHSKRMQIVENAFSLREENTSYILNSHILMVDDVVTSGATFAACLRQLHSFHPRQVSLVALAHEG